MRAAVLALLLAAAEAPPPVAPAPAPAPPAPAPALPAPALRVLPPVGDVAVVAFDAPLFAQLPREQRLLAYWLARAGALGDPIAWEQSWRHNPAIVRLLRGILAHPQAVPRELLAKVRDHARALYLNRGSHDETTGRKLLPAFTAAELRLAAQAAQAAGADFGLGRGIRLETALRSLEGPIFDPRVDPLRTDKAKTGGGDPLLRSAVNFYSGVSREDLAGFKERYPLNSRLVKEAGKLREQVLRAGAPASRKQAAVPPGLHAERLAQVAAALEEAQKLARGPQAASIRELIAFLRTGEPDAFRASQREWLKEAAPVDYVLGFIETYADPRGQKGLWEGFTGMADPAREGVLRALAGAAQHYEDAMPWPAEYKREKAALPAAAALWPLSGAGDSRPLGFAGVNLPNEQAERERYGSKSLLVPAIDDATSEVRTARLLAEFAPPESAAEVVRCHEQLRFALVAFHELVGHASGRLSARLAAERKDPSELFGGDYDTLEEARADLVAHWHAADPKTRELGLIPDERCQAIYPQYATTDLSLFVSGIPQGDRVEEDHDRGSALTLAWLLEKGAIAWQKPAGKRSLAVTDPARWRAACGELLALLQQLKSQGDAAGLRALLGPRAGKLDPSWRDEVAARTRALGLPRKVALLPPVLEPVEGPPRRKGGRPEVVDATARVAADLDAQILADWEAF